MLKEVRLLDNGEISRAKELIGCIDAMEYLEQAVNAKQVNLLFSVLIHLGKNDEAINALNNAYVFRRFSIFDDMDISERIAVDVFARQQVRVLASVRHGDPPAARSATEDRNDSSSGRAAAWPSPVVHLQV